MFVELAAVRNEARAQARIVKEALDQFRAVFETLQSSNESRAVAARDDPSVAEGWVIAEARVGFEWDGELLRAAEVIVAKHTGSKDSADRREAK